MSLFRRPTATAPGAPASTGPAGAGAAISLDKVRAAAPGLVDMYKKAGVSLAKNGLAGERAAVYLVLDRSGSMRGYYQDGSVQRLAEQVLGLSAQLDDDGVAPVVFFDSSAYKPVNVELSDYTGRVNRANDQLGSMGSTNYAAAMEAVIKLHRKAKTSAPALVIFQTDGSPDSRRAAQRTLCEASTLPIFWQFIGFGNDDFAFLRKLDELAVPGARAVDNAGFFPAGPTPGAVADADLYDKLTAEYPVWLAAARAQGIVR